MSQNQIRVRFAPSPTGSLHVGGARTALYNWLFARGRNGAFVLRIEDTDAARSTPESEEGVLRDLKWLGVDWDEGPDRGGAYAPYRQSERKDLYTSFALTLLDRGSAYRCYCTGEELEAEKARQLAQGSPPHYGGRCRRLSAEERTEFEKAGRPSSVRFLAPQREYALKDLVRGDVRFPAGVVGDFILLRSDGMPTYNFSCVVDDYLMRITHVIRAEEHLSNTVRQLMLYEAFGVEPPSFAHLSIILNRERAKLSKRDGVTSVAEFRKMGYLPDAMANYLALLGWSPGHDREVMSAEELVASFSLERAAKAAAVFDTAKLDWMNGRYIRKTDLDALLQMSLPYFRETALMEAGEEKLRKILLAVRDGLAKLSDLRYHVAAFERERPEFEPEAAALLKAPSSRELVSVAANLLERSGMRSQEEAK
ncbi:MAG: glutamate--tRNA ligase, partial [Candidatus Eisenbacteria bacterium]|nr:glutamate--tRNA ligase [Candidatus Eisenbacteria bacterium]